MLKIKIIEIHMRRFTIGNIQTADINEEMDELYIRGQV